MSDCCANRPQRYTIFDLYQRLGTFLRTCSRAVHTAVLVDNLARLFGCHHEEDFWGDVYLYETGK